MGEYRQVPTDDGAFAVYLEMPKKSPAPAVVVLQEIFGINDDMRESWRIRALSRSARTCSGGRSLALRSTVGRRPSGRRACRYTKTSTAT